MPNCERKHSLISSARFLVTPLMSHSQSGWCSMTSSASAPNFSMIRVAVTGPTPFTAPDER